MGGKGGCARCMVQRAAGVGPRETGMPGNRLAGLKRKQLRDLGSYHTIQ